MKRLSETTFRIPEMDCPSEEQMIRIHIGDDPRVEALTFDLQERSLRVLHSGSYEPLQQKLASLFPLTTLLSTAAADNITPPTETESSSNQRRVLLTVLIINLIFFVVEMVAGLVSRSMGLVADSLDMLADSLVYAMALYAVGGTVMRKKRIARLAGYFQLILALVGFAEVIRRFIGAEAMPDFRTMIIVSLLALVANIYCLRLLQQSKSSEAHMRASMIFTSNDIIINSGVIIAGILVLLLNSALPDLITGAVVFLIVARGAWRILRLAR